MSRPATPWWLPAGLLLAAVAARGAEDEVTARLQPELIGVDELAHLTIEVRGGGLGDTSFDLENLEIVGGPSSSQNFQWVNGAFSRSESRSWILRPLGVGPARVHSIRVQLGDEIHQPPTLEIEVQEETVGRPPPRSPLGLPDPFERFFPRLDRQPRRPAGRPKVFLRAHLEPADPYVGQQALYTLYLFTQVDVTSINPERLPEFHGMWVKELPQPPDTKLEMVDIDGERFGRVPVLRRALFPLRPGPVELAEARVQLAVRVPDGTLGIRFSQVERVVRESNGVTLTARALPGDPPAGFDGAVGDLEIATALEPERVAVGDASTFSVTVSGAGHIQGLPAPQLPELPGLRAFPPQQESEEHLVATEIRGRRTWTFVLVPEAPGDYELPPLEMAYFDPLPGEYRTVRSAATTLTVTPPAAGAEGAPEQPADDAVADTAPQSAASESDGAAHRLAMLPWLLLGALLVVAGPFAVRRIAASGSGAPAAELRAALKRAAHESRPREAAALVEDGWRRYLERRWGIQPSTPTTRWGELLDGLGAAPTAAEELVRLADDLHYLRYAPQLSDTAALQRELIVRSKKLSRTLK